MAEEIFGFNRADTQAIIEDIGKGDSVQRLAISADVVFGFKITSANVASIYTVDDNDFSSPILTGQGINSSVIFGTLPNNTLGYCVLKSGRYYIIQASCQIEEEYL